MSEQVHDYNLNRPPHLVANQVIREIEALNSVQFGEQSHAFVEHLVSQYQDELAKLEQQLLNERDERIAELEAENAALRQQNEALTAVLKGVLSELAALTTPFEMLVNPYHHDERYKISFGQSHQYVSTRQIHQALMAQKSAWKILGESDE